MMNTMEVPDFFRMIVEEALKEADKDDVISLPLSYREEAVQHFYRSYLASLKAQRE